MDQVGGASVLVAGLGDLGSRTLQLLAGSPRIGRLVGCGAPTARSAGLVAQSALIADTLEGPAQVSYWPLDLSDVSEVAECVRSIAPDVVVFTASRHSWWRTPPSARELPYGVWLPLQVSLLRSFMQAHRQAGSDSVVVALPHPDVAGPVLAAEGLAPHTGAGNVAEVAAKLRLLVAAERGCGRADVDVKLVMHHAVERLAFAVFDPRDRTTTTPLDDDGLPSAPPYLARVSASGKPVPDEVVDRLLRQAYSLPTGTGSHQLTAATTARLVEALLSDDYHQLHVPSPAGLPGGYPVRVGRGAVQLDLPEDISLADAVAVNEQASAFDGIASVGADGTLHYTSEATSAAREVLGLSLERVPLADLTSLADRLEGKLDWLARSDAEPRHRGSSQ